VEVEVRFNFGGLLIFKVVDFQLSVGELASFGLCASIVAVELALRVVVGGVNCGFCMML